MMLFDNPARIIIEYNGMWQLSRLEEMDMPKGWGNCPAYCDCGCQYLPGVYEQHEITLCGDDKKCGYGSFPTDVNRVCLWQPSAEALKL